MYDLIDIYIQRGGRWMYEDATRMHPTIVSAARHYAALYGCAVRARYAYPSAD
jgi:hypothetical protein